MSDSGFVVWHGRAQGSEPDCTFAARSRTLLLKNPLRTTLSIDLRLLCSSLVVVLGGAACTMVPAARHDVPDASDEAVQDVPSVDATVAPNDAPNAPMDVPTDLPTDTATDVPDPMGRDVPTVSDVPTGDGSTLPPINAGSIPSPVGQGTIRFSGYTFRVREALAAGPGPNDWSAQNVFVDERGYLHLKVVNRAGRWSCAEVFTLESFSFGTFRFAVLGHPEQLDPNVVGGLFLYSGPDGVNELDIEFTSWGGAQLERGNWAIYPSMLGPAPQTHRFNMLNTDYTEHSMQWGSTMVRYQYLARGYPPQLSHEWVYPAPVRANVPQTPMPLHLNLWLFRGAAPANAAEAELVITNFSYTAG